MRPALHSGAHRVYLLHHSPLVLREVPSESAHRTDLGAHGRRIPLTLAALGFELLEFLRRARPCRFPHRRTRRTCPAKRNGTATIGPDALP